MRAEPTPAQGTSSAPGCTCGHALHRSKTRTPVELFLRHIVRVSKYRCGRCGRVRWTRSEWEAVRRTVHRAHRDPVARRVLLQSWRRKVFVVLFVVGVAIILGQLVGWWHGALMSVEPVP